MTEAVRKRPAGLGRGLSALLGEANQEAPALGGARGVRTLPVTELEPHPEQPRRFFDDTALDELARSIETRGLIQPIVVRPWNGKYQIVAGERRWRAAQRARLHEIPVIIREFDEAETLELALIENIQREDLNAIEEAQAYSKLISRFGHSQEALGRIVHKSRSHIANLLRLLDLPERVRAMVADGRLSMGHARAIITAPDPEGLAQQVVERGLSVRETERLAQAARPEAQRPARLPKESDADIAALERQLGDLLGLKVKISYGGGAGAVTLGFSSLDQLDLICQRLTGERI
ncbi:ParB/RepB/Spo0J family partition protein [Sphingomonas sp.]|jgi:ParB family chromosome partitioning protein|uniref:ParB/RepB/Spo0J family partition protein n=1 Tax=Sphingomonas sp. TaxID=28214 RepID=UPI002DF53EAC|nr:ParB/RepB/Spo0J family partition protein [Sphingomonas sp.]HEV2569930.1 ParB/RepB/Spo0J family partition protein [Sphingomonas sp.]